jgi:hypothetical protein
VTRNPPPDGVTRIPPPDDLAPGVTYHEWRWGSDEQRRPGLPWIGVFLVVFGGLLLLEQALPQYRGLGNVLLLAAGIASLIVWAIRRGSVALYAGAFLTALAAPGTYEAATGTNLGPGWGTLCFGLAFLFIAVIRSLRGGGWGWQLMWGSILGLLGAVEILQPDISGIAFPLILVVIGILLLVGNRNRAS